MPELLAIASFLDALLETHTYTPIENTLYRYSVRPVARLGLAIKADFDVPAWAEAQLLDAVFLHRPWKVDAQPLPPDIGILAAHLPLDDHLTLAANPRLAAALGMMQWQPFGDKAGRPLGMLGPIVPTDLDTLRTRLADIFGALEHSPDNLPPVAVTHIVVVNALTDALVREAHAHGAQAYITGQMRAAAHDAVQEIGLAVFAVGHRRCEEWGLRALAGLLRERWAGLSVCIAD